MKNTHFIKKAIVVLLLSTIMQVGFSQEIELRIEKKNSDAPLTDKEHLYILSAKNRTENTVQFQINTENVNCSEKKTNVNQNMELYSSDLSRLIASNKPSPRITLEPGQSEEFILKITRPESTILNSWNCSGIKAIDRNNKVISNELKIESFIPDPKDFR